MQENVDNAKKQENVDNGKRNRSTDISSINPPKRRRTAPSSNRSFAEVAKGERIFSIVDLSNADGKTSRSQCQWVEVALCNAFLDVLKEMSGQLSECTVAGWFQEAVKLIGSDDDRSAESAVSKVGQIYKGANLEACEAADVPFRPSLDTLKTCGSRQQH